ncbi:hypothetical protein [Prescottella agglutinans]|uniref:Uncharacterized protein (DUF1778 family) n=1 Tax=Prescottella agglutinans TaxID=1644129 RepID=A0ABT6M765_9NOCA|nr:hypothetical protein [Prescottella agglutinans]MDH6280144.1 uncharacterized protein (DUF1778 family) [Prescottella agglutinans]
MPRFEPLVAKSPAFERIGLSTKARATLLTEQIGSILQQQNIDHLAEIRSLTSQQFNLTTLIQMSQDALRGRSTFVPTDEQWDQLAEQFTELSTPTDDLDLENPDAVSAEMQEAVDAIFADIEPLLSGNHELEAVQAHLETRYGAETCRWMLVGFVGMLWSFAYYTIGLINPEAMSLVMDTTGMDLKSTLFLGYLAATKLFPYPNKEH